MNKLRFTFYLTWMGLNLVGAILAGISIKFNGDGWGLLAWSLGWELYICHKLSKFLGEE